MSDSHIGHDLTRIVVLPDHEGSRVDVFLAASTGFSRRAARRLLSDGEVWLNGKPLRVQSRKVYAGDVVDILRPAAELSVTGLPSPPSPTVLYEDRWLMAVAKPAGVLSAPIQNMDPGELSLDQQVLLATALEHGRRPYLRLIHRLDRMTSGVILFSRHSEANAPLRKAWDSGRAERVYFAVMEGHPSFEEMTIDKPITRDRLHEWRFVTHLEGKPAVTEIAVMARRSDDLSVVRCRLITGRTHQVRVHLASIGHAVLGDRLYGSARQSRASRPLLHARSISLPHPRTRKQLQVVCPFPSDMEEYLDSGLASEHDK